MEDVIRVAREERGLPRILLFSRRYGARSLGSRGARARRPCRFLWLNAGLLSERGLEGRERDPRGELLLLRPNAGGDRELPFGAEQRCAAADACAVSVPESQHDSDGWRRHSAEQRQGGIGELGVCEGPSRAFRRQVEMERGVDGRLSQEHALLTSKEPIDYSKYPVGTVLEVLPNHSCMTAAQHKEFLIVEGDSVIDKWTPAKFW